ncbi:hypothetical protein [Chitinimonas sp.]|uniref:hypothetical protein n=1 Tax=Chitinimonas sp. TaxID=1934313 RepID=UPI0035B48AC1
MSKLEKFRVRPGYKSAALLIEFCGDHRATSFPDIAALLASSLNARYKQHPTLDVVHIGLASDEFISLWEYENGEYELIDDTWSLFIFAPTNNAQIISDIERALLLSNLFSREMIDSAAT